MRARSNDPAVPPRSQPSIAVSADGERWSIVNASPDIRDQLFRFPALHPRAGTRDVPLDTVVLTVLNGLFEKRRLVRSPPTIMRATPKNGMNSLAALTIAVSW